jgi:Uma2 family endonuclease
MNETANMSRSATYSDLYAVPQNMVGEIILGQLITQPRPGPRHAVAASAIGSMLHSRFASKSGGDGSDGCWILDEPECHFVDDVLVPDIAGWRKSSMPCAPETSWFDIRPDWVCEVICPSTAKYDRGAKRDIYAREGVGHMWIVDPEHRFIEVLTLVDGSWL